MAERRMFAKSIIDSDIFLDMPQSTQNLYFHLAMRADDDGFINSPKKIMRVIGAGDDDLKILLAKRYILGFDSGVIVIKHWKIHNYIQKDRYKPTLYVEEYNRLIEKENGAYTECIHDVSKLETSCTPRLGKVSIDKDSMPSGKKDDPLFESFWTAYPRKEGKGQAKKAYASQIRKGASHELIMERLKVYTAQLQAAKTEKQFIRHPATFLNNLDDYVHVDVPDPKSEPEQSEFLRLYGPKQMTPEERAMIMRSYEKQS